MVLKNLKGAFAHDATELQNLVILANPYPKPFFTKNYGSSKIWQLYGSRLRLHNGGRRGKKN